MEDDRGLEALQWTIKPCVPTHDLLSIVSEGPTRKESTLLLILIQSQYNR